MKTFQIRITKEGKHHCLKFKSELPTESVLGAVKAVVKNTYHVSIKEINWKVPEDRDIIWAIKEAASVRFYHKVWKETVTEVPTVKIACNMAMPKGTKVDYNCTTTNTFFDICISDYWVKLDISKINMMTDLDVHTTNNGMHQFYLRGHYEIKCKEFNTFTLVTFYKVYIKSVVKGEFVTEEL